MKFKCRNCGVKGLAHFSSETPFIHAPWYVGSNGLQHGFLYCRGCGTVHDTIGSLLGPIKMLFGSIPSKVVAYYDFSSFKKLTRMSAFALVAGLHPIVLDAMEEDGRLTEEDFEDAPGDRPPESFLVECLSDENPVVRAQATAEMERRGYGNKR